MTSTSPLVPDPSGHGTRRARTATAGGLLATGLLVAGLVGGGFLAGCSSDDGAADAAAVSTTVGRIRAITVSATDYAFEGLPDEVPAGTRLELVNDSAVEIHELVAFRLEDGDDRPVEEVLRDPTLQTTMPTTVLVTPPGAEQIPAVGDGTLAEPGRYLVVCTIPTGVDPEEFLAAMQAAAGGKPEIPNAGAPHLAHGMFAEVTVV